MHVICLTCRPAVACHEARVNTKVNLRAHKRVDLTTGQLASGGVP